MRKSAVSSALTALFSLAAARPVLAAPTRMETSAAMRAITTEACQRVFGAEASQEVDACIDEYMHNDDGESLSFEEQGNAGDKECLAAGGILLERMEACTVALTGTIAADRADDAGAFLRAIGELIVHCAAEQLCQP